MSGNKMINLKEVLELHTKWLRDEPDGIRADLSGADLRWANLRGADLSGADLSHIKGQDIFNFTLGKDQGVYLNGNVTIGCKSFTLDHWLANFKSIGTEARYTDNEIVRYGAMLNLIKNL